MGEGTVAENRVEIVISGDASGAKRALAEVSQQSQRLGDTLRDIGKQMLGFAGGLALFEGAKQAVSGLALAGLQINARLEQAAIQFKVLTGSASEAQRTVEYLYKYAAKTPFEFQGIMQAASVIQGAKLEMEKWIPVIGDMAASGQAAGLTMDQVAMAIARVRSGQVGEFFERVGAYLGITREDLKKYGIQWEASGELADRSGAGIQKVIDAIYQESTRRFKGMAEEQSNTFAGMWSTIKDTFGMIQAEVMKPFFENLRLNIMPAMRELSSNFLEAYKSGGLLAGLKEILPPQVAEGAAKMAEAWRSVKEAAQGLWIAIKPLATEAGRLAAATFGGLISVSTELARALADLIKQFLQIPGAALVVQALAGSFLLFRVVIPLVTGLGKAIWTLSGISAIANIVAQAVGLMRLQWVLGAAAGASFVSRIMAMFTRLGAFLLGGVKWWAVLVGAAVAAAVLIIRNWQQVGPFFVAVGRVISGAAHFAAKSVMLYFEQMSFGAIAATRGLVAGVSDQFAKLMDVLIPLAGRILPEAWLEPMRRVAEAAQRFADAQRQHVHWAGAQLDSAKAQVQEAAASLSEAWSQVKETGKAAWGAVKADVLNMAKSVTDAFKGVGGAAQVASDDVTDGTRQMEEGTQGAAQGVKALEEALQKLRQAAGSVAHALSAVFSAFGRALGAGLRAASGLAKEIQLAMVQVEEYIAAGGKESGRAIMAALREALNMVPWAVQEIGPKTTTLLQRLGQAAAMLIQLPMDEAKKRGIELAAAVHEAWAELREKARDYAYDVMRHIAGIGGMTLRQQADYLRQLIAAYEWSTAERWRLEEELYQKNLDILNDQAQAIKDAYDRRLQIIKDETDAEVRLLEGRLKALDESDKLGDREKSRRDHEKKLADLIEQRRYHELRTGREHQKAIADIDKQIAEENQRWQELQHDWSIEDQKAQIREEIDLAKERGEERKRALQKEFDDTLKLYEGHFKKLSARLAIWEPEYINKYAEIGRKAIEALAAGQKAGMPALEAIRREIEAMVPGMGARAETYVPQPPAADAAAKVPKTHVVTRGQYETINGSAAMPARALAGLLGLPEPKWDATTGQVKIGEKVFSPLALRDGTSWLSIRQVGEEFGYKVNWDPSGQILLQKAHSGAKVRTPGIAELAPGELIFPAGLSAKLERLISVLEGQPAGKVSGGVIFNAPLFHVDKVELEDKQDMEIFSRELGRSVKIILGGVSA